jgi:LCP family protein required for cell wall assembly
VVSPVSSLAFLRRFAIACLAVTLVTATGVWAGNRFARESFAATKQVELPNLVPARPGKPANYLLIGSDTRQAGNEEFGEVEGQRSDVMMVLHVDPAKRTGRLVSFPRDLVVNIPGRGQTLINEAYGAGGPSLVIETLESNFPPLKINHYIEVDFKGFEAIVNAIGKVPLYFPTPAHDPYSGLNIDEPGCVKADGATALAYARSRHYYVPEDPENPVPWQWNYSPDLPEDADRGGDGWYATGSDLDRIPRQQYFLRTISQAALDKTAANPTKLWALLDAVKDNFTRDTKLKYSEMQDLIRTFKGLDPRRVKMETLPVAQGTGEFRNNVIATDAANAVIASLMLFGDPSPPIPERLPANEVRVRVVNGSGIPEAGQEVYDKMLAAGFALTGPVEEADRSNYGRTQIRYAPGKYQQGYTVIVSIGSLNVVPAYSRANTLDADVLLVVGRDYKKLSADSAEPPPTTTTAPKARPFSTTSSTSTTTTTPTTVPTTVDTRFIPRDPATGAEIVGCPEQ